MLSLYQLAYSLRHCPMTVEIRIIHVKAHTVKARTVHVKEYTVKAYSYERAFTVKDPTVKKKRARPKKHYDKA